MTKLITDASKEPGFNQFADLKKAAEERFGKTVHKSEPHMPKMPHLPKPRRRRIMGFPGPMSAQMNRGKM